MRAQLDPGKMQQASFKERKVLWTGLPQGTYERDGRKLAQVAAFASVRLRSQTGNALSEFPEFLDWPAVVNGMEFSVDFGGGHVAKGSAKQKASSELWKELFRPETRLQPFEFDDFSKRAIRSYPVRWIAGFVRTQYSSLAASDADELPAVGSLLAPGMFGALHFKRGEEEELRGTLEQQMARGKGISIKDLGPVTDPQAHRKAFLLAKMFHEPQTPHPVPLPRYPAERQRFEEMVDFHQMLAALANFPQMMRMLGLLVELELDASEVPDSGPGQPRFLQLVSQQFQPQDVRPRTAYVSDGRRFMSACRPGSTEYVWGMRQFQDAASYEVVQFDADGAAIKLLNLAHDLARAQQNKSQDTPAEQGVPSLRSGGFSVARVDKGVETAEGFDAAKGLEDELQKGHEPDLYAEDLARGYRVDVWDSATTQWHSLNWRRGDYRYKDDKEQHAIEEGFADEGWLQTGATQSADPSVPKDDKDLYVHESLFNWKGWGLSAPRPGRSIDPQDEASAIGPVTATQMKLSATFGPVKGTLPRLRYGRAYRFRSRMVDLGGWGIRQEDADSTNATPELPYLRFEPVPPPVVLLTSPLDADVRSGEGLERLVIRSFNDERSKDGDASKEASERHVAPPRTSQVEAEQLGMFDDPSTGKMRMDPQTYALIAAKDKGFFERAASNDPIDQGDEAKLPYLPDPMALGAALVGLPGELASSIFQYQGQAKPAARKQDFGDAAKWPEMRAFRVRLEEGDGQPEWDGSKRLLRLCLPKAGVARFRISCYPPPDRLGWLGLWHWLEDAKAKGKVDQAKFDRLRRAALDGRHWMLTPFRTVELVHAVQQPLGAPEIGVLYPHRMFGKTYCDINGAISLDGKSSIKMEMMAEWQERRDEPDDPKNDPVKDRVARKACAFDFHVEPSETGKQFIADYARMHEFGDTRYRKVSYRAVATSRFKEYMPKALRDDPKAVFWRESGAVEIEIPNAARPAAPRVAYVLPLFGWSRPGGGKSVRRGSALRVYLERPWFSSGDGEKLAVVLWPGALPADDEELDRIKPFITMIGQDPIWRSSGTPESLSMASFPKRHDSSRAGLPLKELGAPVDVAAYDVAYDPEKGMWFADIELAAGSSYTPFVRLALARYHPVSVDKAHLSPVVLAEFAQPVPERSLSVVRMPGSVRVTLSGHSYSAHLGQEGGQPEEGHCEVEVTLERYDSSIGTDLGWAVERNAAVANDPVCAPPVLWSGTVALPEVKDGDAKLPPRRRVTVKEYETLVQDARELQGYNFGAFPVKPARRLVYADHVEL